MLLYRLDLSVCNGYLLLHVINNKTRTVCMQVSLCGLERVRNHLGKMRILS